MALILNLETSTTVCSVALGKEGKVIALNEINDGYSHAEQLEILISKTLEKAGVAISDLDAVAVSKGPGSYTGLRIGVSMAKGICYGANISLLSVPTLEAMAYHPQLDKFPNAYKVPMLDARRMEVYACVLDATYAVVQETSAIVLDENSFSEALQKNVCVFFGPGMEKSKEILDSNKSAYFQVGVLPSAAQMVEISNKKFEKNQVEDVAYFEPFYLKDFVAGKPKKLL